MVRAANSASSLILTVLSLALASPIVHAGCAPDAGARNIEISTRQQGPAASPLALQDPQVSAASAVSDVAENDTRTALLALGKLEDADTALSMAADGAALYDREKVKLDGYAYCSQAVELAEKGEFRESAQAASKDNRFACHG